MSHFQVFFCVKFKQCRNDFTFRKNIKGHDITERKYDVSLKPLKNVSQTRENLKKKNLKQMKGKDMDIDRQNKRKMSMNSKKDT